MAADDQRQPVATPDGHFDLDTLADIDAGVFDAAVMADVTAHTTDCPQCSVLVASLSAVRLDLSSLPVPAMPASVAARLDAALRAEQRPEQRPVGLGNGSAPDAEPHRAPGSGSGRQPVPSAVPSLTAASRRRSATRHRWIGSVAAAAVLVVGGITAWGMPASDENPGRGSIAEKNAGDDGGDAAPESAVTEKQPEPGTAAEVPGPTELPEYTRGNIEDNIEEILVRAYCDETGQCGSPQAGPMASDALRDRCTSALRREGIQGDPMAIQYAMFEGRLAFVFVFSSSKAVVVSAVCGQTLDADVLYGS